MNDPSTLTSLHRLLTSVVFVLVCMASFGLVEARVPFRPAGRGGRLRLRANLGLTAITLGLNVVLAVGAARVTGGARRGGFGALDGTHLPPWALGVLGVAVLDLATWGAHWLMHHVPLSRSGGPSRESPSPARAPARSAPLRPPAAAGLPQSVRADRGAST